MKVRKRLVGGIALTSLATTCAVGALAVGAGASPSATTAAAEKKVSIAEFVPQLNNTYTQADIAGVKAAAKAEGNTTVRTFNSNFQPAVQVRQCNDAVSSGKYNAFVIQTIVGSSVVPCIKRAIAKKIKVVAIQNAIGPSFATLKPQVPGVVGSVFVPSPYEADRVLKQLYRVCGSRECKVAQLIGVAGFGFDAARDAIIDDALKSHPNIKIVSRQATGFQEAEAYNQMRTILQGNPDINVMLTSGDQIALGGEKALAQANKQVGKDVKVISTGSSKEALARIADGRWEATGIMMPFTTGKTGATLAIRAVRGEKLGKTQVLVPELFRKGGELLKSNVKGFKAEYSSR